MLHDYLIYLKDLVHGTIVNSLYRIRSGLYDNTVHTQSPSITPDGLPEFSKPTAYKNVSTSNTTIITG